MKGLGEKITEFTNLYFTECFNEANSLNSELISEPEKFLFHLIDKIVENFASIGEMMKLSEKDRMSYLKNSLYVLLRSNLSDVIVLAWLIGDSDSIKTNTTKEKIKELRRDHVKFHISYMKKMESLGLLSSDDKKFEIEVINSSYKHLLQEEIKSDLNIKKFNKSISITGMLDKTNKDVPLLVDAYKIYFIFSKVEHVGEFTRMILEKTYDKENENPMDEYIRTSINIIQDTIKVSVPFFLKRKEFIEKIQAFTIVE